MRGRCKKQGDTDQRAGEAREVACGSGAARSQNFIHAPKGNTQLWRIRGAFRPLFSHQSCSLRLA